MVAADLARGLSIPAAGLCSLQRIGGAVGRAKAIEYLKQEQRRRIAVLLGDRRPPDEVATQREIEVVHRQIVSAGLETKRHWLMRILPDPTYPVRTYTRTLMDPGQAERPDGLIIGDDNLVEPALMGLHDAGVKAPDDVEVVAILVPGGQFRHGHPVPYSVHAKSHAVVSQGGWILRGGGLTLKRWSHERRAARIACNTTELC